MNSQENLKILFVHNKPDVAYSETFVKAQIDNLPFTMEYICVRTKFDITKNEALLYDKNKFYSLKEKIKRKFLRIDHNKALYKVNLQKIKSFKPDVIIAQYGPTGIHILDYAKDLGIKLIVHFHGYDACQYDILKKYDNYKKLFEYASALIVVSKEMQVQLTNIGAISEKVFFNCYGIDSSRFVKKTSYTGYQLIAVGRFTEKKAPHITLYVFSIVLKQIPSATLIMIGDGPLLSVCMQLADALKINASVKFVGAANHTEVAEYMNDSVVFVQHSLKAGNGDCEGTPLAVLEAMSCGLPIVSTRHAGIKDAVLENETGFLVNEKDAEAMAEKIIELLKDPELCEKLGQAAHERIKNQYQLSRYINDLSNIIQNVTNT